MINIVRTIVKYLLIITLVFEAALARAQDSLRIKWGVEVGVASVGYGIRGQLTIDDEHRMLVGLAQAARWQYDFPPLRIGYQYAPLREGKKLRWLYTFEASYGKKTHLSPSRLLLTDNGFMVSDIYFRSDRTHLLVGFGMEFNLLKYFKINGYPLVGYQIHKGSKQYQNPNIPSVYFDYSGFSLGFSVGLTYEFSQK
ncbi:MAG: hypothetical protein JKY52_04790 [Flavobacteriales bacterium]|nr:hypothetical protein [Flavobacteriales bacterium]